MTPFPREDLRAWLVSLTGLAAAAIVFDDEPEAFTTGPGRLRVAITSDEAASIEQVWTDAVSPVGAAVVTTKELDYLTFGLVYELQAPATTNLPNDALRRIRQKAWQQAYLNSLEAIGFSLIDTGNITRINGRSSEGRAVPYATMDLKLGFSSVDVVVSPTEMATDFIMGTDTAGTITDLPTTVTVTVRTP